MTHPAPTASTAMPTTIQAKDRLRADPSTPSATPSSPTERSFQESVALERGPVPVSRKVRIPQRSGSRSSKGQRLAPPEKFNYR
jgi:hypothetical protein